MKIALMIHMDKNRKKNGRSIFTTQTASYLLFILLITITFSFFFFTTAKKHLEREVGRKLQDIAKIAARNAPFERLDLIKTGDDQTRMVLRLKEKLGEIREATGVKNIIIFRPDYTSLIDLHSDKPIGTTYKLPHFDKSFLAELDKNKSIRTGSYSTTNGSLFMSAFAPVTDDQGHLFAIVGVDAGTREVEVIEQMRSRLYLIASIGTVLAFFLALFLARRLTNPIRGMAQAAEQIGKGEYEARVPIPSTAELGVLANSINEMARQVQRRDAKLKEMSASVAHEIRNPLNSIKLLITLLDEELQDYNDNMSSKTIETLHYEIGKLNHFLMEFLTYSRPVSLIRDKVDPLDLGRGAVEMAAAQAKEKSVDVSVKSDVLLPTILVDRQRLEQSLLNILLNAVNACDRGGRVTLEIKPWKDEKGVEFVVSDSGPGITEEEKDRLFEPFFTTKDSGTGLGLSNAEKIIKSHGGTIFAEDIPSGGARFTIRLPLVNSDLKEK